MQPGARRRQLDETLRTAYSEGLLSESTFMTRLDQVLGEATIDPRRLVGDLTLGATRGPASAARRLLSRVGSKNRTVLNGRTMERAQLRPGDYVSFAKPTFCVD
jgi:hypothetical protein